MPVQEVADEPEVQPNRVYVIPPGREMVIAEGRLHLRPRDVQTLHRSVDRFLRSLAEDQKHHAIGVILSGTATDGTLGLSAIKSEGGITLAQDDTAQQTGMPHSGIAEGSVDFVLPPHEIAQELVRIARHPPLPLANLDGTDSAGDIRNVLHVSDLNAAGIEIARAGTVFPQSAEAPHTRAGAIRSERSCYRAPTPRAAQSHWAVTSWGP